MGKQRFPRATMWLPFSILLLLLPLVASQSSSNPAGSAPASSGSQPVSASGSVSHAAPSAQITVITSLTTSIGFTGNRQVVTSTFTILSTSTIPPTTSTTAPQASSSASATSTSSTILVTGTAVPVSDVAPSPGATGGSYGPDDNYITNAAQSIRAPVVTCVALLAAGLLLV